MRSNLTVLTTIVLLACGAASAQTGVATSFETGRGEAPEGWKLSDKFGKWEEGGRTGRRSISLVGDGKRSSGWVFQPAPLGPNRTYRFSVWYRSEETGDNTHGVIVTSIASVEKIFSHSPDWTQLEFTFTTPVDMGNRGVRLGQWHFNGKIWYDDCTITPVSLTFFEKDGIVLDRNERIENGAYVFQPDFRSSFTDCYRVEQEHTRQFHNDKWWFHTNEYQIHRYRVGGHKQRSAEIQFKLTYKDPNMEGHEIKVEAGTDGKTWRTIKTCRDLGEFRFGVPSDFFPADTIFVRISGQGSMQMRAYRYTAPLDGSPPDMEGTTAAFAGNYAVVDNGRLRLVFEEGGRRLVSIHRRGEGIGWIECRIAQFEKKGIGYKGTGIGVAEATAVGPVDVKVREAQRCVIHVTASRAESVPMARRFKAVYEFTVYAGQDWFESKLLSVENTDATVWTLHGYCYLLQPQSTDDAKPLCFPEAAAWMRPGGFLGAAIYSEDDFTLGLRLVGKAAHGDITRKTIVNLKTGQTWTGREPGIMVFVGGGHGPRDVVREARRVRRIAQAPDQYVEGRIVVQEHKRDGS
ncbi:MAG: hypothetical protein GXP25_24790 [Planctomycetes bacterium]|nr:hypothetical protein [Planctomycetota bacterium]